MRKSPPADGCLGVILGGGRDGVPRAKTPSFPFGVVLLSLPFFDCVEVLESRKSYQSFNPVRVRAG